MDKKFEFRQIEGMLDLEHATSELINIANCMKRTHTFESAISGKDMAVRLFEMRKASITALLDLIERYIDQIPEKEPRVHVMFCLSEEIWNKVVVLPKKQAQVEWKGNNQFILEYDNQADFDTFLNSVEGRIEYEVLS